MWTDTHIHLDAAQYAGQQQDLLAQARQKKVSAWVIPAVAPSNFEAVRTLAHATAGAGYALGIHPMYVHQCAPDALERLQAALDAHQHDPKLVAVGEIGLDYFVPSIDDALQRHYFKAQLKLAQRYQLPVIMHTRRAADPISKYLRQTPVVSGIAHAFNGSAQQAQQLVDLGLCLGFGGAATYTRATQIRERLKTLPSSAIVLETDGPDIAPEWLAKQVNPPAALARIGEVLAAIRHEDVQAFAASCTANSCTVLPRLGALCAEPV